MNRLRLLHHAAIVLLALCLSGCLRGVIDVRADGSGFMEVEFPAGTFTSEKRTLRELFPAESFEKSVAGERVLVRVGFARLDELLEMPILGLYELEAEIRSGESAATVEVDLMPLRVWAIRERLDGRDDSREAMRWSVRTPGRILETDATSSEEQKAQWTFSVRSLWDKAKPTAKVVFEGCHGEPGDG